MSHILWMGSIGKRHRYFIFLMVPSGEARLKVGRIIIKKLV